MKDAVAASNYFHFDQTSPEQNEFHFDFQIDKKSVLATKLQPVEFTFIGDHDQISNLQVSIFGN